MNTENLFNMECPKATGQLSGVRVGSMSLSHAAYPLQEGDVQTRLKASKEKNIFVLNTRDNGVPRHRAYPNKEEPSWFLNPWLLHVVFRSPAGSLGSVACVMDANC